MQKRILVYGAGGHAKTVISMLRLMDWDICGIVDDSVDAGLEVSGVPVLGNADVLPKLRADGVDSVVNAIGGIGNYAIRWNIFERLLKLDFSFPTLVHPTAFVEDTARLADGVQILAQSYVSAECTVGFGTLINVAAIVSHNGQIGRCVNLSPGAILAGHVTVEDFAQIGMGVTVNFGVTVGTRARVGNGSTVKEDVPADGRVYAGTIWPPHSVRNCDPQTGKNLRKIA